MRRPPPHVRSRVSSQPLTRPSPDPPPQDDERYEKYLDTAVEVLKVVAMIGAAYFVYRALDR